MNRLRFPQFAQLPSDLKLIVLDYALDKRDPFGFNAPDRNDFANNAVVILGREPVSKRWKNLRLVCREWSQWFSVGAIHCFSGRWDKLSSNQLLEKMPSLTSLEISSPYDDSEESEALELHSTSDEESEESEALELQSTSDQESEESESLEISNPSDKKKLRTEALKRLASMIPSSVRHLTSSSVELLQFLPQEKASALRTVMVSWGAFEPRIIQSVKSLSTKFSGKIKHMKVVFNPDLRIAGWTGALADCPVEELTLASVIMNSDGSGNLPQLPSNLKRLNVDLSELNAGWLAPAASTLEVLNASESIVTICLDMPVMSALKEMRIRQIHDSSARFSQDKTLLSSYWPKLEKLELIDSLGLLLPPGISKMTTLKSIRIMDQYSYDYGVDLSDLPPSLEEFVYSCQRFSKIGGQPQQELKHLCKLELFVQEIDLPKGVFNNMPALEELLLLSNDDESGYKGIQLEELLPLRHTMVDLNVKVRPSSGSQDVLYQFSRLKRLQISCWGFDRLFKLQRLPSSLEKLTLYGDFIGGGLALEELPNLKQLDYSSRDEFSFQLLASIMQHAPNLQVVNFSPDYYEEEADELFEEMDGKTLDSLERLEFEVKLEPLAERVAELLEMFPNIQFLRAYQSDIKAIANFPSKLLSFLKRNPSIGTQLKTIAVGFDIKIKGLTEASKKAFKNLQDMGIQLA